jgi:hypothetical protein
MFRLLRILILLGAVFVAGILYERNGMTDNCLDRGGNIEKGICIGARQ